MITTAWAAEQRLATWRAAVAAPAGPDAGELVAALRAALADDLDTPLALRVVDEWSEAALAGTGSDSTAPAAVGAAVDALLGIHL